MIEFLNECINPVNLPATILLLSAIGYWLMMIVGVVGFDTFDFDMDVDADVDLDMDMDFGLDGHGGGAGTTGGTTLGGGSSATGNEGILRTLFDFFYLGDVPIVFIGTGFVLFFWIATFITNNLFNTNQSILVMLMWLTPNMLVSLILTRYSMIPFAFVFQKQGPDDESRQDMLGLIGRVTTSTVNETFGQVEIKPDNEPEILINARSQPGKTLGKNDAAKIISYNTSNGTFLVELSKWENKADD